MKSESTIFWNVDTQKDFVEPGGKLYVKDAEKLKPIWESIRDLADVMNIKVVNTADYHFADAPEISSEPDYIHSFPPHCLAGTTGAEYVDETKPDSPLIIAWENEMPLSELKPMLHKSRNIVVLKNVFDMFAGNPNTDNIMNILSPETVVVYGVTTNVCVDFAVRGLVGRVKHVYVINDAIKELPLIPLPFGDWENIGVKLISSARLKELFDQ